MKYSLYQLNSWTIKHPSCVLLSPDPYILYNDIKKKKVQILIFKRLDIYFCLTGFILSFSSLIGPSKYFMIQVTHFHTTLLYAALLLSHSHQGLKDTS